MFDIETAIIGAGVIGLAIARELSLSGREVMILERQGRFGSETSSRNSEVIHAGIYYQPGSLKARYCVAGRKLLYAYCAKYGIAHQRIGKLIVATRQAQLSELKSIKANAEANGVSNLTFVDQAELKKLEPALASTGALLSPSTGIVDSHAYMLALLGEAEGAGAQLALNTSVEKVERMPADGYRIIAGDFGFTCKEVVIAAGLWSSSLFAESSLGLAEPVPVTAYAKGNYFRLAGRAPFCRLIYPAPEPGGLGIHLTLDMGGQAKFGPDVEWVDQPDYVVNPDRAASFYSAIRRYWPDLPDNALAPDFAGIRPKIGGRDAPNVDFKIIGGAAQGAPGLVALLGIESPGLTSSLAIAGAVRAMLNP